MSERRMTQNDERTTAGNKDEAPEAGFRMLRSMDRTLLELLTGVVFSGILMLLPVLVFAKDRRMAVISLLAGLLLAVLGIWHQYFSLNRALDHDPETAQKRIYSAYLVRYFSLAAALAVICLTDLFSPLFVFLGLFAWKTAAYLQPLDHKLYNHLFHESDPVPVTEEEYQASLAAAKEAAAGAPEKEPGEPGTEQNLS
ncbi:MAG: ATP synthase subunit I [Lachnospiraceae bacterium]|nr:ATP synthase subunit I [Lachnospiraceae bacterium]